MAQRWRMGLETRKGGRIDSLLSQIACKYLCLKIASLIYICPAKALYGTATKWLSLV